MLSTIIIINVLDKEGYTTGRAVPVEIQYDLEIDNDYGADADGNRGVPRVLSIPTKIDIPDEKMKRSLLKEELEQVLADAKDAFDEVNLL